MSFHQTSFKAERKKREVEEIGGRGEGEGGMEEVR